MGKKEVRAEELLQIIEKRRTVSIKALAALMNVSELTIRRDIRAMEEKNLVRNIRGTVFFNREQMDDHYLLSVATNQHTKEKKSHRSLCGLADPPRGTGHYRQWFHY